MGKEILRFAQEFLEETKKMDKEKLLSEKLSFIDDYLLIAIGDIVRYFEAYLSLFKKKHLIINFAKRFRKFIHENEDFDEFKSNFEQFFVLNFSDVFRVSPKKSFSCIQ